ncbi:AAA family ATPase [Acinetobacter baumannii]|uniref:AAA family ATPase n=10 Tax=Acinetobacter baumannii TaxID=470 RepID=UPI001F2FFE18|nr:AAA family ATPase [Acinetobacter baumannii]MCF1298760.1 ATP-binding protein [Acinetobacter baumannii]HAV4521283.1 AAA family ATPase [Acinetobacter baumannii]HAV4562799.1 AAA family ATPase [Acinetobacter baumannii]
MKLISFKAKKVFGIFDFNIDFNQDINLIIGKNGTGKTTFLKIIIAIFSKDYIYLSQINFESIELNFQNENNDNISILLDEYIKNSIDYDIELISYRVSAKELDCEYIVSIRDKKLFELIRLPEKLSEEALLNIETPMFLGLDRRFVNTQKQFKDSAKNFLFNFEGEINTFKDEPLEAIKELISTTVSKNRAKLFSQNTKLRNNLLKIFLEEIPNDFKITAEHLQNIFSAHEKFIKIQGSIKNLMLNDQVIELINQRLLDYSLLSSELRKKFENISAINSDIYKYNPSIYTNIIEEISEQIRDGLNDYVRLSKVLDELEKFQEKYKEIYKRINLFNKLVNGFFENTNKKIYIRGNGSLKIKINENLFNLDILSSGERQIIILIGNLIFNDSVSNKKIFIIDEPELSLHIYWQEIFLNSLIEGSEDIQFIIATHSPSIVSEYSDFIIETNSNPEDFIN